MKAKEYYAKYGERLMNPDKQDEALTEFFMEFLEETDRVVEQRKARTNKALLAVIDEFNNKWNALCEMFPTTVLIRNGYQAYWYDKLGLIKETADMVRRGEI